MAKKFSFAKLCWHRGSFSTTLGLKSRNRSMLKKVLKLLFLSDKRKSRRENLSPMDHILVFHQGRTFKVLNISDKGMALINQQDNSIKLGDSFNGELEFRMSENASFVGVVVRLDKKVIGIKLQNQSSEFKEVLGHITQYSQSS